MGERIHVPLELDDFDVLSSEVIDGVLEVHVESSFPTACFHCGSVGVVGHGRCRRRIRDRSVGRPTVLVWHQRRLCCRDCGRTSRERHLALAGRRSLTERFHRPLFEEACRRPFSEVAAAHGVSHWRVVEAFDARAPYAVEPVGRPRGRAGTPSQGGAPSGGVGAQPARRRPARAHGPVAEPAVVAGTILAHFEDRQTNAFAEGVTNKVKVMKRRSYGFGNIRRYRLKVLLTCSC